MQNFPPFLSVAETATTFRISRSTVYNFAASGRLPLRKLGGRTLISTADVLALLGGEK